MTTIPTTPKTPVLVISERQEVRMPGGKRSLFKAPGKVSWEATNGILTQGDALLFARSLRDEIADLVFLDPPFNLGKNYGIRSRIENSEPGEYHEYMTNLVREMVRVLKPGGALFLYHLPYWAARLTLELNGLLQFRHWIAVAMKSGFVRGRRLYPAHYALLYLTKGTPSRFHRPKYAAKTCRSCGELVKDYGGYKAIIQRQGINLSDVWDDLSPVRHKSRKNRTANELPQKLTDRVVAIAGEPRTLLVDPFVGSGTSLISARDAGMSFLGNDLSQAALNISMSRLERPSTTAVQRQPARIRRHHAKGGVRG